MTELKEREVKPKGDGGGSGLQDGFHKPMCEGVKKGKLPSNEEQINEERHPHYEPQHVCFFKSLYRL